MFFVRKKLTDSSLDDGIGLCHETFTYSMDGLGKRWLLVLFINSGNTQSLLNGRSSFPSLFHFGIPLLMPLGADEEAPSLSFCLRVVADALTKALCLAASISVKVKR